MSRTQRTNLRSIRRQYDILQEQLEQASEVSQSTISLIERGQTNPTLDVLEKLMDGFHKLGINLTWDELLGDEGKSKTNPVESSTMSLATA